MLLYGICAVVDSFYIKVESNLEFALNYACDNNQSPCGCIKTPQRLFDL